MKNNKFLVIDDKVRRNYVGEAHILVVSLFIAYSVVHIVNGTVANPWVIVSYSILELVVARAYRFFGGNWVLVGIHLGFGLLALVPAIRILML